MKKITSRNVFGMVLVFFICIMLSSTVYAAEEKVVLRGNTAYDS